MPPFRPNLSAIGTSSYEIAKFLVPRMNSITSKEFTVKAFFALQKKYLSKAVPLLCIV